MQGQLRVLIGAVLIGALVGVSLGEIECQGKTIKLNETQIAQTKECLGYHGSTSIWQLPEKDFPCFGSCLFQARGFLSEDGEEILKDTVLNHIKKVVDEKESKILVERLTKCVDESGKNLGTKTDKTCMKFMKFGQCLRESFLDTCI